MSNHTLFPCLKGTNVDFPRPFEFLLIHELLVLLPDFSVVFSFCLRDLGILCFERVWDGERRASEHQFKRGCLSVCVSSVVVREFHGVNCGEPFLRVGGAINQ